jgi:hypothetical protein
MAIKPEEMSKVQSYLQRKLGSRNIALKAARDGAELILDGEFFGTVYKDEEDGETTYEITIAVLEGDLD